MIEARLTPGRGFRPINSLLYYGMRLLPYAWSRHTIAYLLAQRVNRLHPADKHFGFDPQPIRNILDALQRSGSICLEPLLSQTQIAEMVSFLQNRNLSANGRFFRADQAPADLSLATYPLGDVVSCPHVLSLINNGTVLGIASAYLGCCPTISSIYLQWSFPERDQAADVQCFHRDPDDWRFLKLFMYLTEVDEESGPHEFVIGSHRSSGRIFSKPYSEEEVERAYGRDHIIKITGPKGTTFIEDTWGIHRGRVPVARPRLLLQVQYSILPIMKLEYRPMSLPDVSGYDSYVNRFLFG